MGSGGLLVAIKIKLAIAIPSYDRPEKAKETLLKLLPQVDGSKIRVVVLDNGSFIDYQSYFLESSELAKAIKNGYLVIHRNPANLGMSANILRAFEIFESEWLWVLSDDDQINPQAVMEIISAISVCEKTCGFIKLGEIDIDDSRVNNINQFIKINLTSRCNFNSFIFISNGVYRLNDFRKYLHVGYEHAHTYIPHFMMIAAYVNAGGKIAIFNKEIVKYIVPKVGYSYGMVAGLGVGGVKTLLLKLTPGQTRDFYTIFFPHNDFKVILDLYFYCKFLSTPVVFRYLAINYIHLVSIARPVWHILLIRLLLLLCRFPKLLEILLVNIVMRNKEFNSHVAKIKLQYSKKNN